MESSLFVLSVFEGFWIERNECGLRPELKTVRCSMVQQHMDKPVVRMVSKYGR